MKIKWSFKKKHNCDICKDTGVYKHKRIVPHDQLPPHELADIWINGGYAYMVESMPCPNGPHNDDS